MIGELMKTLIFLIDDNGAPLKLINADALGGGTEKGFRK